MSEQAQPVEVDPRVVLAAERTMLAWIRTGVGLMALGFVVARSGFFMREALDLAHEAPQAPLGAAAMGVALVAGGILVNAWASVRHLRMVGAITRGEPFNATPRGTVAIGLATAVCGAILVAVLMLGRLR